MKRLLIGALAFAGAAFTTGSPAHAAGGCGPSFFPGPYGFCRPFYGPRVVYDRPFYRPFYGPRFAYGYRRPIYHRAYVDDPFYGPRRFFY